ncbi:hypothetical protein Bhyg_08910 [Pseudolycoriella hygida]|uniref:Uncharacterized protein n=1 Tax=Pseudolycoriella hygida TaxID=35572 RepID=A0A9Q0S598_9DIPT|nr:hypothetical protein Bhyg_08910 [Pseudolycoriella hygida]
MSIDEFTHVTALVRGLHAPPKNVSRPKSMEKTGVTDDNDDPIDHHTYTHPFPTREQPFPQTSFSIPSLVVTGIDNTDHPFGSGSGNRRFSNFNLGLRRFSASFMVRIYNANCVIDIKKGESTVPWGKPQFMGKKSEVQFPICTHCTLPERDD